MKRSLKKTTPTTKMRPKESPETQSERFINTARELGCDEDPEAFERVFARVVPPRKPPGRPAGEKSTNRPKRRLVAKGKGMKLLPKSEWTFDRAKDGGLIVGAHEHNGYVWHTQFALSDLPNDLVSLDDLERLGIDRIDRGAIREPESRKKFAD